MSLDNEVAVYCGCCGEGATWIPEKRMCKTHAAMDSALPHGHRPEWCKYRAETYGGESVQCANPEWKHGPFGFDHEYVP